MALDYAYSSDRKERISDIVELSEDPGKKHRKFRLVKSLEDKASGDVEKKQTTWRYLDALGAEYHALVQGGHGTSVENRTPRQIEIADTLIEGTQDYISKLIYQMTLGPGMILKPHGREMIIKLKSDTFEFEELVYEAIVAFRTDLHKYNPDRASISTFIPYAIVRPLKKLVTDHSELSIEKLESKGFFRDYYMRDRSENADPERAVIKKDFLEKISAAISQLPPLERMIVRARYGFIDGTETERPKLAEELGLTRQRIGQLEKQALQRLRKILTKTQ